MKGGPLGPHKDRLSGTPTGFAKEVIGTRILLSMSQEAASREIGISRVTLARVETGRETAFVTREKIEKWLAAHGLKKEAAAVPSPPSGTI